MAARGTLENAYRIARFLAAKFGREWQNPVCDGEDYEVVALMAAWKAVECYDAARGASLETWVYTAVLYDLRLERRHSVRLRGREEPLTEAGYVLRDPNPGPAECAAREWERAVVRAAVEALPEREAEALHLRWWEDRQYRDIGARMEMPKTTAHLLVSRAQAHLARRLSGVFGEDAR